MAKKQTKPVEAGLGGRVAAATPEPEAAAVETVIDDPLAAEPLTSDDRGDPAGHVLAAAGSADTSEAEPDEPPLAPEPKPTEVWKPGSCINCGETTTDAVQVSADERFRCTRCRHEWTLAEEQAPFRRLARR